MKYYFRFRDIPQHDPYEYYSKEELDAIPVYPETQELITELETDINSDLWPVYDADHFSWDAVECKDEAEAKDYLADSLQREVFEHIYDI